MVLSYRHGYHAGNFADVLKHSVLSLLLTRFHSKPTAYYYLDTHAGGALYDLRSSVESQKTREYQAGIARLWKRKDTPKEMTPYLTCLRALNGIRPIMPHHQQKGTTVAPTLAANAISKSKPTKSSSTMIGYAFEPPPPASATFTQQPASSQSAKPQRRPEFAWNHIVHAYHQQQQQQHLDEQLQSSSTDPSASIPSFTWPSSAYSPSALRHYPGSTLLSAFFQRQTPLRDEEGKVIKEGVQDRAVMCEIHKTEVEGLRKWYGKEVKETEDAASINATAAASLPPPSHLLSSSVRSRLHIMSINGFFGLTSHNSNIFLAPKQNRGLILIDPPYETVEEEEQLLHALPLAYNRFRNGIYAIWYPIIDYSPGSVQKLNVERMKQKMKEMNIPKMMCVEMVLDREGVKEERRRKMRDEGRIEEDEDGEQQSPAASGLLPMLDAPSTSTNASSIYNSSRQRGLGMIGTGMILINPPHGFEEQAKRICEYLANVLPAPASSASEVEEDGVEQADDTKPATTTTPATWSVEWLTPEQTGAIKATSVVATAPTAAKQKPKQQKQAASKWNKNEVREGRK